jgi:hypothetical protein
MIRVKPAKNHLAKVLNRIGSEFLDDFAAARSDVKMEEILYCYQIGSVHPFTETLLPGAGLNGRSDSGPPTLNTYSATTPT